MFALSRLTAACLSISAFGVIALPSAALADTACRAPLDVCAEAPQGGFPLIVAGAPAPVHVDAGEHERVRRAAESLARDLGRLGGRETGLKAPGAGAPQLVIVGTLENSPTVRKLVAAGKLDVSSIKGAWEGFVQAVVEKPLPGVERALVIAGSDDRGAIYGAYDLIDRAGVSPWEFWADVPIERRESLYVAAGLRHDAPEIRYRGIFLNDENPALYGWVNHTYGGFNAQFYERVFELILRLKGNYLWPAMWGKAIYDDDPNTAKMAERYGVVLGTSHHEPLMRAHVEWARYGEGPWDYTRNAEKLREFWRKGVERIGGEDTIITIGMRGDGDEAMTEGTAIELLETIVRDQRKIIADVTGRPASEQPQIWALYKEVQDYYDKGMKVPDDVTLLFADDNWGNIRRLPAPGSERPGGYGVYYHFDYVGGPRNYKWLNTNQIERVWEQMHLAWEYGAHNLWIVNVGDLKPMEFPIDFFLDYAWDPKDWPLERLPSYSRTWAAEQFGETHATEIAALLDLYTKYNSRRKHELLDPDTYSLANYGEWPRVVADYTALAVRADRVRAALPPQYDDAFMQLVWFPIHASANLNKLYYTVALNRLYAQQGRALTNVMAERARALYARDAELTRIYHEDIADGKWVHMMSQTHIGYTYWQQPEEQVMPEVREIALAPEGSLGLALKGGAQSLTGSGTLTAPAIDDVNRQFRTIELFNRGATPTRFSAKANVPWLRVSQARGTVSDQTALEVGADWDRVPAGEHTARVTVTGPRGTVGTVLVPVRKRANAALNGFVPDAGVIAMEATDATCKVAVGASAWRTIPNLGRTGSGVTTFPVTHNAFAAGAGPRLEFDIVADRAGPHVVEAILSPTLDFTGGDGLSFALSIDDGPPQIVTIDMEPDSPEWNMSVSDNAHRRSVEFAISEPGAHVLKFWAMEPGVVLQRLVVSEGGAAPKSHLGPPASRRVGQARACGG